MATCVPLSRLELMLDDLVPRRAARIVWCDDGEGVAAPAAARMLRARLRRRQRARLAASAPGRAEGFRALQRHPCAEQGVRGSGRARGEDALHLGARAAGDARRSKADIVIYDSRSFEEYHNNSIPTAISVPGAELVYRFADLAPSPDTLVVVNCGGRTRSIVGAQSLIAAGVSNRVVSLKDGTMAWHLAGLEVVHGAKRRPPEVSSQGSPTRRLPPRKSPRVAALPASTAQRSRPGARESAERTLYLLDVRTPAEYEAGHLRGARSAPGGQLVQETDYHLATWGARVVLLDDNGVRASMTASWLKQMGWHDVAVLVATEAYGDWEYGPHRPRVLGLKRSRRLRIGVRQSARTGLRRTRR